MLKRIAIASAVLATVPALVFAGGQFYLGANVGLVHSSFYLHDAAVNAIQASKINPQVGVFGGYGIPVYENKFYVGGEAFASLTNRAQGYAASPDGTNGTKLRFSNKYSYGVSFIPGVMLDTNTMAYARVGAVVSKLGALMYRNTSNLNGRSSVRRVGAQLGGGFQTNLSCLSPNLDLRAEYVVSMYRKFPLSNGTTYYDNIYTASDQANLGLVYKIG